MRIPWVQSTVITVTLCMLIASVSACSSSSESASPAASATISQAAAPAVSPAGQAAAAEQQSTDVLAEVPATGQMENQNTLNTNEETAAAKERAEAAEMDFQDYKGEWSDAEFNQYSGCDECALFLGFDEFGGERSLSLVVYDGERLVDFAGDYEISGNSGTFSFEDESVKGKGIFKLAKDRVTLRVDLESGEDELVQLFSKERSLVRDPYKGIVRHDPLVLAANYVQNRKEAPQELTYELDPGAEWNEEMLAGEEVEIVIGRDAAGGLVSRYSVNTLNSHVEEFPLNETQEADEYPTNEE